MSHFTVTVLCPAEAGESATALKEYLDGVLDRYDENREVEPYLDEDGRKTTYNPESKWDWWLIGGRWRGYFLPKEGADYRHLIGGEPGTFNNEPKSYFDESGEKRYRVDGGPMRLLDLEGMRHEKGKQAELDYDQYREVVAGTPEPLPWSHFHDRYMGAVGAMPIGRYAATLVAENEVNARYGMPATIDFDEIPPELNYGPDGEGDGPYWTERGQAEERLRETSLDDFTRWEADKKAAVAHALAEWDAGLSYSMDQARADYQDQPRVQAVRQSEHYKRWLDDPIATFDHLTRDEYVQQQRDRAVPGYATIALDGEWLAPGRMGWWGMSSDDETSYEMYARKVNELIDSLPGDTVIVALDCHI